MTGRYVVRWSVLMRAPSGLYSQWVTVREPTEAQALQTVQAVRPDWTPVEVKREAW